MWAKIAEVFGKLWWLWLFVAAFALAVAVGMQVSLDMFDEASAGELTKGEVFVLVMVHAIVSGLISFSQSK